MQNITLTWVTDSHLLQVLVHGERSKGIELFTLVLSVATIAVGTVGNVLLCFTIATSPSLRTPMNTFVLSIALVDLLTSLVLLPLRVVVERKLLSRQEIEPTLYQVELFVRTFTDTTRLFLMMSLSVERYQSIAKPLMVSKDHAKRRALVMSGATWTVSIVLSLVSIRYFCDTILHDPCVDYTSSTMPNWGDLEAFVELPLSLISITTIAISYGLIVLILRQQRTKMKGHTQPKVNQVAPASSEKKPDSTINNVPKVTVMDASSKVKSSNLKAVGAVNQEAFTTNSSIKKWKNVLKVGKYLKLDVDTGTPSSNKGRKVLKVSSDLKPDVGTDIPTSDKVKNLLEVSSDLKPDVGTDIPTSDKVKNLLEVSRDLKPDVGTDIPTSDKVKDLLEVSSDLKPGVGTDIPTSDKEKNCLQIEDDVKQQASAIINSRDSVGNPNEATREVTAYTTPSHNVAGLGDASHQLPTDIAVNHDAMNLLKTENDTRHQHLVTPPAGASCNSCAGKHDINEDCLRNFIKEITHVDINGDNMVYKETDDLKKGENTLLQINRDGLLAVDNSVDQKHNSSVISCDCNHSVSSSVTNNDNTSESHNTVQNILEDTIIDKNLKESSQIVVLNSAQITMESSHSSPRRLGADCQRHVIDSMDIVTSHPSKDISSAPNTLLYETRAQSTNSQSEVVFQHNDFRGNQSGNVTEKLSLPPDHTRACSQVDLLNESAEENTLKISNSSSSGKNFSSHGNRLETCVGESTHPPQNLNETRLATSSSGELPQSNNSFLKISKVQQSHLHSTEFLPTNKRADNIRHPKTQNLSAPFDQRTGAISLQDDNSRPPELFCVPTQLSGNDEYKNTLNCNNYQTSSNSSYSCSNSTDVIVDLTHSISIDSKTITENPGEKPHHSSPRSSLSHEHQDVQRICDNCIDSSSSTCCHYSGNILPNHPNSTDEPNLSKGNVENYQDQSVTSHLSTKQTIPDYTKSVNENDNPSISYTNISLTNGATSHQPVLIYSSEGKQLQSQCIDRVILPVVTKDIGTAELVSNVEANQSNCDKGAHSFISINESANVTSDNVYVCELANAGRDKMPVDESSNVISDKSKVDESAVVTSDKATVDESAVVTSDKVPVDESSNVVSNKVTANEISIVTRDKATVAESAVVTSDKATVAESAVVTSDKATVAESAQVTKDEATSHLTPIKSAAEGKRFQVVDMEGNVHMQLVNSHPTTIEGAVCLMNPRNKEQGKRRVELKAALKVGLLVCCFVCLWMPLPISICIFRGTLGDSQTMKVDILAVFTSLAASTAAVDPILYGLLNRQIRSALLASVMKIRRKLKNFRK